MAIEDAPRLPAEHDEPVQGIDSAKPVVRESFVDWVKNRFQPGETPWGKLLAGETGEDDTEDDDTAGEVTIPNKKRPSFFKGLRELIIPKPERIPHNRSQAESDSAVLSDNSTAEYYPGSENSISSERAQESVYTETRTSDTVVEGTNNGADVDASEEATDNEPQEIAFDNGGDSYESPIYERSANIITPPISLEGSGSAPSAPVESIQSILQRQHQLHEESVGASTSEVSRDVERGTPPPVSSNEYYTNARNPDRHNPVPGLVALDVLNYGVAKHRDKKNEKASIRRDEAIKKEQQKIAEKNEKKLSSQDLYQKELSRRLEKQEKQQQERLPKVRNKEFRTTLPEANSNNTKIVENNTTNNRKVEQYTAVEINNTQPVASIETRMPIVAAPDVALPSADTILHKVEEAAEKNIPIETQYELRHERKGNEDFSAVSSNVGLTKASAGLSTDSGTHSTSATSSQRDLAQGQTSNTQDYQKAAAAGTLGAIFGIVLFIILYVLSG